jgi:tetratricopeptide (TPR) repeat protein
MVQELARAYQYTEGKTLGKTVTGEDAARRATTARELERTLTGDLAVICTKALDHEPARRYASARELADDLESWLASRPVKARPATATYRASKFLRRNWALSLATLLILIATITGTLGTIREKRIAERRFEDVRRLARYQIFDLYDQMLEVDGTTRIRAGMSAEALKYLDALADESKFNEALAIELALGYQRLGDVTGNYSTQSLGNWKQAAQLYEKGLRILAPFQSSQAKRTRATLNQAYTVARNSLDPQPQFQNTIEALIKDFEATLAQDPRNPENYLNLGKAYAALARTIQRQPNASGLLDRGTAFSRQATETLEQGLDRDPDSKPILIALHMVAGEPANWLAQTKPEEAIRWANKAEMWRLRLPESTRNSIAVKRDWASLLSSRASALFALGEKEEGRNEMYRALKVFEGMASDPDNLTAKNDLYTVLHNLSLLEDELNNSKEFLEISERMLVLAEDLLRLSPTPRMNFYLQNALGNLCYAYSTAKDPRADATLGRTFAILEKQAKDQPKDTTSRATMADLLLNLAHPGYNQADKALAYANEIVAIVPGEFSGWELVSMAHFNLKNYPEAIAALEKTITLIPAPKPGQTPSGLYLKLNERLTRYRAKFASNN